MCEEGVGGWQICYRAAGRFAAEVLAQGVT